MFGRFGLPLSSFLAIVAAVGLSPYWMTPSRYFFMNTYAGLHGEAKSSEWSRDPREVSKISRHSLEALKRENARLSLENRILRKDITATSVLRKGFEHDLRHLPIDIISNKSILGRRMWIGNVGKDRGVLEGDYLVQNLSLLGRVVSVAETCCLIEGTCAPETKFTVKLGELNEVALWNGMGERRAEIHVQKEEGLETGLNIYLGAARSLGGGLLMAKVIGLDSQVQTNSFTLIVEAPRLEPFVPCFILQQLEKKPDVFSNRDRLSRFKKEVRRLERNKLRMELLRK